jgi:transposase-like protein
MAISAALQRPGVRPWPMDKIPDPEVPERPTRRRFSGAYKLAILLELDQAAEPGAKGAIMRREGLYSSSSITEWRRERAAGDSRALARPRGPHPADPLIAENKRLRTKVDHLQVRLGRAEKVITVQGNVSAYGFRWISPPDSAAFSLWTDVANSAKCVSDTPRARRLLSTALRRRLSGEVFRRLQADEAARVGFDDVSRVAA